MSYLSRRNAVTRMIQLNADGTQTGAVNGDKIKLPTKTTTGGDSVSITAAGVISLSSSFDYYIRVEPDLERSIKTSDVQLDFYNESTSSTMTQAQGAMSCRMLPTQTVYPDQSGVEMGQLIISQPGHDISIRLSQLGSNTVDINTGFHLFIVEIEL